MKSPDYAELHCLSNFSFLRGASHAEELVAQAATLGYSALAITDECSLAGIVRAHTQAQAQKLALIVGSEFRLDDLRVVLLACNRAGYAQLCRLITRARGRADKGRYRALVDDFPDTDNCIALLVPDGDTAHDHLRAIAGYFPARAWLAVELLCGADDAAQLAHLRALGAELKLPLVAAGDVHMHVRGRRALQDTLTAIRLGTTVAAAGFALYPNGERHLRPRARLARIYPAELLQATQTIAARCRFSLNELRYEYPREWLPPNLTAREYLRALTEWGIAERWPQGISARVRALIEHELALIAELEYEAYFLTVRDLVAFARGRGILCQGRGSAANSAVCYCLHITEIDPERMQTLFERFISKERNEPPDIDVDFEHERREEVIQYIYQKYGRERAAIAATVISYRTRSAVRDVGKALGLELAQVERLAKALSWWEGIEALPDRLQSLGFTLSHPTIKQLLILVATLLGFPRHLSQHVGGMVMSHVELSSMVPIENAAMAERTVIQWDKNDLDAVGLLKVDCLALGMLTAIRKTLALMEQKTARPWRVQDIPAEDSQVYAMIQCADTVGVFQIESRAQMSMLPRLKPRTFYDLVIQVAIVRPGPIQGGMVHPYLRRRAGDEPVTYPSEEVRAVLERTLGVPIFQEQVIKLATVAAGFTPGEADRLRRSMAAWHRQGGLEPFERRLIDGMRARGYSEDFARQIFAQIQGFGEYGFPESHSASFALIAYLSAWLKCHAPAAYTCGLLNSQPMGFYAPAQLIQDARRHGVAVRPVDVCASAWDCSLEGEGAVSAKNGPLRMGLRMVKGLSYAGAERLCTARAQAPFADVADLAHRARLTRSDIKALAQADALRGLAGHRHRAHWQALGVQAPLPLFGSEANIEGTPLLAAPALVQEVTADYASVGLSLRCHPLALMRARLNDLRVATAADLAQRRSAGHVVTAGLVTCRQRPHTAAGVMFLTLEDETGVSNIIVWQDVAERCRHALLHAPVIWVAGRFQREGEVTHIVAHELRAISAPALPAARNG